MKRSAFDRRTSQLYKKNPRRNFRRSNTSGISYVWFDSDALLKPVFEAVFPCFVGKNIVVEFGCVADYFCRDAAYNHVSVNAFVDYGIRGYDNVVFDDYRALDDCSRSDVDSVADARTFFVRPLTDYRNIVADFAVVADDRLRIDQDSDSAVVEECSFSDACFVADAAIICGENYELQQFGKQGNVVEIEPPSQAVDMNRVEHDNFGDGLVVDYQLRVTVRPERESDMSTRRALGRLGDVWSV